MINQRHTQSMWATPWPVNREARSGGPRQRRGGGSPTCFWCAFVALPLGRPGFVNPLVSGTCHSERVKRNARRGACREPGPCFTLYGHF